MYEPELFRETRVDVMHALMRSAPLATLVILDANGLNANHLPLRIAAEPAPFGTLRGHVARANPLWREFRPDVEVLAIFQGPDAYVSPSNYPTKRQTGKVVPTWNYAVVHAHGTLRVRGDPAWLRAFLEELTSEHEAKYAVQWKVSDAPEDFIATQVRAIVGLELVITKLVGKWKVSQNRLPADQRGVVAGLSASTDPNDRAMSELVAERAKK
jgi:transcriptional regulator